MPALSFPLYSPFGAVDAVAASLGVSSPGAPARSPALDVTTGDLVLQGGQLAFVAGAEAIRQNNQTRLAMFEGEWFLDVEDGLPLYDGILVKAPNLNAIRGFLRDRILGTPGVTEILALDLTYDRANRTLRVSYSANTDEGVVTDTFAPGVAE